MEPKDKVKELIDKFTEANSYTHYARENAKDFALICINEIIEAFPDCEIYDIPFKEYNYWLQVKKEIEYYTNEN